MNTKRLSTPKVAFGLVELIVTLGVLVLVLSIAVAYLAVPKQKASKVNCKGKLMRIGMAFSQYAQNNNGQFPMLRFHRETNQPAAIIVTRSFQELSNIIGNLNFLICPADTRRPAPSWRSLTNYNISYFLSLYANYNISSEILGGDRNVTVLPNSIVSNDLRWNPKIGLHKTRGNILFTDGHVKEFSNAQLINNVKASNSFKLFAIP